MNKYIVSGLILLVIVLGIAVITFNPTSKSDKNVLGSVASFSSLAPNDFNKTIISGNYKLIDIRTTEEYNAGHLKNAIQNDYYQTQAFSDYLDSLNKNDKYLIYCRSGNRSGKTLQLMKTKGFTSVSDLAGGYNAWLAANLPTEK